MSEDSSAPEPDRHLDLANVPYSVRSVAPASTTIVKGSRSGPTEVAELLAADIRIRAGNASALDVSKGIDGPDDR